MQGSVIKILLSKLKKVIELYKLLMAVSVVLFLSKRLNHLWDKSFYISIQGSEGMFAHKK